MSDRWDEALRGLRGQPVDDRLAREVRGSVMARIARERRLRWLWAGAAAAMVAAVGLWNGAGVDAPVERTAPVVRAQARPPEAPVPLPQKRAARKVSRRPAPTASEPMRIQMLTDDPDLVIIWLVGDETGGGE